MAEGTGLEPASPKAVVFKTTALPITLPLQRHDIVYSKKSQK